MLGIGDFARHGRVSVRMLRHYDALGLLSPAHTDPSSGYRYYDATQLSRLNRIIALKDLGFTLQQVLEILEQKVSVEELRGMLRLRRAELEESIAADTARLAGVEERLATIEREGILPGDEVVLKRIPPVRVAELSAVAGNFEPECIGPALTPLFPELFERLDRAGVSPIMPTVAYYEDAAEGDESVLVHAAVPVNVRPGDAYDFAIVDLPEIACAATIVHRGPMDDVLATGQTLARWVDGNGYRSNGYPRELYVQYGCGEPDDWVTELQEPVVPAAR